MKILIVVPRVLHGNNDVTYEYSFPLGLAYVSSVLKKANHHVDCLNLNHNKGTTENLVQKPLGKEKKYDFVCTGGLSTFYKQIRPIVDAVHKSKSGTGLILGGGIITSEPELMFNTFNPNYIVIGEGEKTIQQLLSCLENKGNIEDVSGIGYRNMHGDFVCTKAQAPIMDLDTIPWPDYEGFEFGTFLDHMRPTDQYYFDIYDFPRAYSILGSRSCPFLCTFCFHPLGNKYRQRSIDSIIAELDVMVKRYKINIIGIYDELFSFNKERTYEFCTRIKKLFEEISWECKWYCQMRVDKVDKDLIKIMKDSGCYFILYGFESYSPIVLESMRKHVTPQQIDQAIHTTLENNLSFQGNFLFGDTAETVRTAYETLDYWKHHSYTGIILTYINPYPGSAIYQRCLERGIIKDKLDFVENHIADIINMSETMTDREFDKLKLDIFEAELRYWIYVKPLAMKKIKKSTYRIWIKCPHCGKVVEYNNYYIVFKFFFVFLMYCRKCRHRFFLVSNSYKFISRLILSFNSMFSISIRIILYNFQRKIRPFIKRTFLGIKE